jgi:hypothetical protein
MRNHNDGDEYDDDDDNDDHFLNWLWNFYV